MLRHIAVFTWKPDTTAEQVAGVVTALEAFAAEVPEVRAYRVGPDLGLSAAPGDFAVAADFDDEAGWRVYDQHPQHAVIRADVLGPLLGERMVVQYLL